MVRCEQAGRACSIVHQESCREDRRWAKERASRRWEAQHDGTVPEVPDELLGTAGAVAAKVARHGGAGGWRACQGLRRSVMLNPSHG